MTGILLMVKAVFGSLGKWLKTPTGAITAFILLLIVALAWALNSRANFKDQAQEWKDKSVRDSTYYAFRDALRKSILDTLLTKGVYEIDTSQYVDSIHNLKSQIKNLNGLLRQAYGDTVIQLDTLPCPELSGVIRIDTSGEYGLKDNPFRVRVSGRYYWPEKYSSQNWTVIDVRGWEKPPYLPPGRPISKGYAIGLASYVLPTDGQGTGLAVGPALRFNRLWLSVGYDGWRKSWAAMAAGELLRF
jgi:hypothetical protein